MARWSPRKLLDFLFINCLKGYFFLQNAVHCIQRFRNFRIFYLEIWNTHPNILNNNFFYYLLLLLEYLSSYKPKITIKIYWWEFRVPKWKINNQFKQHCRNLQNLLPEKNFGIQHSNTAFLCTIGISKYFARLHTTLILYK